MSLWANQRFQNGFNNVLRIAYEGPDVKGYLTHHPPHQRILQSPYDYGPTVILGVYVFLMSEAPLLCPQCATQLRVAGP
jgi:hypothetical protein